jgi:dUTP pyrophosphatase
MKLSRIRDVKLPTRGTSRSAGIDFYIPKFNARFVHDLRVKNDSFIEILENEVELKPHERILIPSGIKLSVPKGHMFAAYNKSGVATKKGLDILAAVCDEDYQGELHISLYNTANNYISIFEDEKIVQFILIPVLYESIEEVAIENLYSEITERSDGGFGSTSHI